MTTTHVMTPMASSLVFHDMIPSLLQHDMISCLSLHHLLAVKVSCVISMRPFEPMGLRLRDVHPGCGGGVVVVGFERKSSGKRAGMQQGDRITDVDGETRRLPDLCFCLGVNVSTSCINISILLLRSLILGLFLSNFVCVLCLYTRYSSLAVCPYLPL